MADFLRQAPPETRLRATMMRRPDPDAEGRFSAALRLGVDPRRIPRDKQARDDLVGRAIIESTDWGRIAQHSPSVAAWMEASDEHAAMARRDTGLLGFIEAQARKIADSVKVGSMQVELSDIIGRQRGNPLFRSATPEDNRRAEEIRKELRLREELDLDFGLDSYMANAPSYIAKQVPIVGRTFAGGLTNGVAGAGLGAGLGSVFGPGAFVGAGAGFAGGLISGMFRAGFELESNLMYDEMIQSGVDSETAEKYSYVGGLIAGSAELLGFVPIGRAFAPAAKNFGKWAARGALKKHLLNSASRVTLMQAAKNVGLGAAGEGATEYFQEWTSIIATEMAKDASSNKEVEFTDLMNRTINNPEMRARAAAAAAEGIAAGGGFSMGGSVASYMSDVKQAGKAIASQNFINAYSDAIQNSELAKVSPQATASVLKAVSEGSGISHVYTPAVEFDEHIKGLGGDAAEVANELGVEGFESAKESDGNIKIPIEQYGARLASDPKHAEFMADNSSPFSNGLTPKEAREVHKLGTNLEKIPELYEDYQADSLSPEGLVAVQELAINTRKQLRGIKAMSAAQKDALTDLIEHNARSMLSRGVDIKKFNNLFALNFKNLQTEDQRTRGHFSIPIPGGRATISIAKNADAKTVVHELGHAFAVQLSTLAQTEGLGESFVRDWGTLAEHVGADSSTPLSVLTTEQNEKLAKSFEAYVFQGKSPSSILARTFSRFMRWMRKAYKMLRLNGLQLSDSVTSVFDRMLATDSAISAQRSLSRMDMGWLRQIHPNLEKANDLIEEVHAEAQGMELARERARLQREASTAWRKRHAEVYAEIKEDLTRENKPHWVQQVAMGLIPVNGNRVTLNTEEIIELKGDEFLGTLNEGTHMSGGTPLAAAAELTNFSSPVEMLRTLSGMETLDEAANRMATEQMSKDPKFAPERSRAQVEFDAMDAVHNSKASRLMHETLSIMTTGKFAELQKLDSKLARELPRMAVIKEAALVEIRAKSLGQIEPASYMRAAARASTKAREARSKGDFEGAFDQLLKQLINNELYLEASRQRKKAFRAIDSSERFHEKPMRTRITRRDNKMLGDVDKILEQFGTPIGMTREGRKDAYASKPVDEILELQQNLTDIEKMSATDGERNVRLRQSIKDYLDHHKEVFGSQEKRTDAFGRVKKGPLKKLLDSSVAKYMDGAEFMAEQMDGEQSLGPFSRATFMKVAAAEAREAKILRDIHSDMKAIMKKYGKRRRQLMQKLDIEGLSEPITRVQAMNVLFHSGSINKQILMKSYNWNAVQVQNIINALNRADVEYVQAYQDMFDNKLWPLVAEVEQRVNGFAPQKIEAKGFTWRGEKFRGGYAPLISDRKYMLETMKVGEDLRVTSHGGHPYSVMTQRGHAKQRTSLQGRNLYIDDLNWVGTHIHNVVHDATHREPLMDASRFLSNKDVQAAMIDVGGSNMSRAWRNWMNYVGAGDYTGYQSPLLSMMTYIRGGVSAAVMGFKLSTALIQPAGLTISVKEIGEGDSVQGLKYLTHGMNAMFGAGFTESQTLALANGDTHVLHGKSGGAIHFRRVANDVFEASEDMRNRGNNITRETREMAQQLLRPGIRRFQAQLTVAAFKPIALMDSFVSIPTWIGAYQRAWDGNVKNAKKNNHEDAVAFADRTVRKSQGSGSPKDLSPVQMNKWSANFSLFYQFWSAQQRQMQQVLRKASLTGDVGELLGSLFWVWFFPAVAESFVMGRRPELDDDSAREWINWALVKEATYPINGVIFARDIMFSLEGEIFRAVGSKSKRLIPRQRRVDFEASPVFGAVEDMISSFGTLLEFSPLSSDENPEISRGERNEMLRAIGVGFHLPSVQAGVWIDLVESYMKNENTPEDPLDFARRLVWKPRN